MHLCADISHVAVIEIVNLLPKHSHHPFLLIVKRPGKEDGLH